MKSNQIRERYLIEVERFRHFEVKEERVHFYSEIIRFDYKLRKGITHKMNVAFLMKQMGILE